MKIISDPLLQIRVRQDGYVDNGSNRGFQKGTKNKYNNYYSVWSLKTNRLYSVHRIIGAAFVPKFSQDFNVVDHIDGGIGNHSSNLRWITQRLNMINQKSARNITFNKLRNKWAAAQRVFGKMQHLGYFEKEEEAFEIAMAFRELTFFCIFMSHLTTKEDAIGAKARGCCYIHGTRASFDLAVELLDSRVRGSRVLRQKVSKLYCLLPAFTWTSETDDEIRHPSFVSK